MLGQAGPTEFDLQFRCFGIPVRVTPWFWLAGVVLGWSTVLAERYDLLIIWLACLFVSIFVHEMGHALVANAFGWPPSIILYHFGGLAMFQPHRGFTSWRSILVSFAGPGAGFLLFGFVIGVELLLVLAGKDAGELGGFAFQQLAWINLAWGLVNLLPVLPLDGGNISQEVFHLLRLRNAYEWSLRLGIVVAGLAAAFFLKFGLQYAGILFALLCVENIQRHQHARGRGWN